jgi:hypothetical protein
MSNVERIENEIRALSPEELAILRRWFREYDAEAWDQEIERDVEAGHLDAIAEAALEEHRKGGSSPL